jgi:hypothetical protein
MSLTEADHLFAGINESGVNDFLVAFFRTRPHYLNYRTTPAVGPIPASASAWTAIPPIGFPGVPGGLHVAIQFAIPTIDFDPDSSGGMPPPLTLAAGQFSLRTTVRLGVLCGVRGKDGDDRDGQPLPTGTLLKTSLELWAVGMASATTTAPGTGWITLDVDQVELVDVTPDPLESVLECLILSMLRGVLANVQLPFSGVTVDMFTLSLSRGPVTETDQAKLYGDVM